MQSTLVLNASFEPLNIVSAQRAITLILNGKAIAVDNSPKTFNSETLSIEIPYVIQLLKMVHKEYRGDAPFSRRGVLVREGFRCVYCSKRASTIDHIIPSSQGGATSYDNCVAACSKCNNKKADHSLEKMGWRIPFTPKAPSPYVMLMNRVKPDSENWEVWTRHIEPWVPARV